MPERATASKELSALLGALGHPHRIRIVEELRSGELDVNGLQAILGISHSGVSQHLALLRLHRIVLERRDGRHVYYRLLQPRLAQWLLNGLDFVEGELAQDDAIRDAVGRARSLWSSTRRGGRSQGD